MKFEETTHKGPLADYINNCKKDRVEAIYNTEYKYIKEIIWDTESNEKYSTREGYDLFRQENEGSVSYSGEVYLRTRTDKQGNILGYITETKMTNNESYRIIMEQYNKAKEKLFEILEVKDIDNFNYWLEENTFKSFKSGPNEMISAIQDLEKIIIDYKSDEDFKKFIDKIKG